MNHVCVWIHSIFFSECLLTMCCWSPHNYLQEVFLVALQLCKDMVQTGWPLCGNSSDPIVEYQLVVQEDGMTNNTIIINQNNSKLVKNTAIVVNHGGLKPYAYSQASQRVRHSLY